MPHECKENIRLTFSVTGEIGLMVTEQIGDVPPGTIPLFYTLPDVTVNGRLELHLGATPGVYDVQGIMIRGGYVLTVQTDNPVFVGLLGDWVTHFQIANGMVVVSAR